MWGWNRDDLPEYGDVFANAASFIAKHRLKIDLCGLDGFMAEPQSDRRPPAGGPRPSCASNDEQ
ncbi:hypothetical protein MESS4_40021 [Mesorhizobium sp. STM 4661]|nr:hypothetical protein MESS4_40021 [Mesorhizobium sp. STM 4661]